MFPVQKTVRAFFVFVIIGVLSLGLQSRAEASCSDSSLTKFEIKRRSLLHIKHLKNVYVEGSREKLSSYLNVWTHWTEPVSQEELDRKLPFDRHANDIFHLLHTPTNLRWFTKWFPRKRPEPALYKKILNYIGILNDENWAEKIYAQIQYSLLQNEIEIYIVETLPEPDDRSWETRREIEKRLKQAIAHVRILDFRPRVQPNEHTPIYLVPTLKGILERFLESSKVLSNETGFQSTHQDTLTNRRLDFLNQELKILRSHWEGWHFETHPFVRSIVFQSRSLKGHRRIPDRIHRGKGFPEEEDSGLGISAGGD